MMPKPAGADVVAFKIIYGRKADPWLCNGCPDHSFPQPKRISCPSSCNATDDSTKVELWWKALTSLAIGLAGPKSNVTVTALLLSYCDESKAVNVIGK